jgi:uncharacterized protein
MTKGGFILALAASISLMVSVNTASAQPGWCRTQSSFNPAERAICQHASLWQLDALLNDTYQGALYMLGRSGQPQQQAALRTSQANWLRNVRNPCGDSVACLSNAYRARIAVLEAIRDGRRGV